MKPKPSSKLKPRIVVLGAHPDDLEGAAGTLFLLRDRYEIHVIDFTRGELGLGTAGLKDGSTARLRVKEERKACAKLGAKAHFLHEVDGFAYATPETTGALAALLKKLAPKAVFLHWPVDLHRDHGMCAASGMKAIELAGLDPEIIFYSEPGQSKLFVPNRAVNITQVAEEKKDLLRCYQCQNPDAFIPAKMAESAQFGLQAVPRVAYAEGFAVLGPPSWRSRSILDEANEVALLYGQHSPSL